MKGGGAIFSLEYDKWIPENPNILGHEKDYSNYESEILNILDIMPNNRTPTAGISPIVRLKRASGDILINSAKMYALSKKTRRPTSLFNAFDILKDIEQEGLLINLENAIIHRKEIDRKKGDVSHGGFTRHLQNLKEELESRKRSPSRDHARDRARDRARSRSRSRDRARARARARARSRSRSPRRYGGTRKKNIKKHKKTYKKT